MIAGENAGKGFTAEPTDEPPRNPVSVERVVAGAAAALSECDFTAAAQK